VPRTRTLSNHLNEQYGTDTPERAAFNAEFSALSLAAELARAREENFVTQQALADASSIRQPMVARIERGNQSPTLPTIVRLLQGLDAAMTVWPTGQVQIVPVATMTGQVMLWQAYRDWTNQEVAQYVIKNQGLLAGNTVRSTFPDRQVALSLAAAELPPAAPPRSQEVTVATGNRSLAA
jgi:transcriptional regulator with XRE-family HTH domain